MKATTWLCSFSAAVWFGGCEVEVGHSDKKNADAGTTIADAAPVKVGTLIPEGLNAAALDQKADPCDDFYRYACGSWLDKTAIPDDQPGVSISDGLTEENEAALKLILEDAVAGKTIVGTTRGQALGDLYATCMDDKTRASSLALFQQERTRLTQISDSASLVGRVAALHDVGAFSALFVFVSQPDLKDPTKNIATLGVGGYTLPARDFYVDDDDGSRGLRAAQLTAMTKVFQALGEAAPADLAASVLVMETRLAKASPTSAERRDPNAQYHLMDRAGLALLAPRFDWTRYFKARGLESLGQMNVASPAFFTEVSHIVDDTPAATVSAYLSWQLARGLAEGLPDAVRGPIVDLGLALTGQSQPPPRWKTCVSLVDTVMGEALGAPYAAKAFGADGKASAQQLVDAIRATFIARLKDLPWMDDATRAEAQKKVDAMVTKIGFPDRPDEYAGLEVSRVSLLANLLRAGSFASRRNLAKIDKPVDRAEWGMTAPTVNAYYNPLGNEMAFPAGILQRPFFDKSASVEINFGAIGSIMGHELTHGFDDTGRLFDASGAVRQWWTPESDAAFRSRAMCVESQANAYTTSAGTHLKGDFTLGENLADLGGVTLSFAAMKERTKGTPEPSGRRFNRDQAFFVAYAQSWCTKVTPALEELLVDSDPHAPSRFRVNGPLSNFGAFAQAFSCRAGTKMVAANACQVW